MVNRLTRTILFPAILLPALLAASSALAPGCKHAPPRVMPNVVLIVIDCLRADHLPLYGYGKETAPFLTEIGRNGIVFDNAFSASSWTAPATASLLTSLYPFQHGVIMGMVASKKMMDKNPEVRINRIPDKVRTLAEALKEHGYRTYSVSGNVNICAEEGFDQGFDRFKNFHYGTAEVINKNLFEWEEEIKGSEPYFVYLHYMDPHKPIVPRAPWYEEKSDPRENDIAKYDSEIRYSDEHIREAFARFAWEKNTVVIVTSDHGEGLWDHGQYGHGFSLHDGVIRVPLIIHGFGVAHPGRRVQANGSLLDIAPTRLDGVGAPPDPQNEGVSLVPYMEDPKVSREDRCIFSHLHRTEQSPEDLIEKAAIFQDWKYYGSSKGFRVLFNLKEDLKEQNDRAEDQASIARQLMERFDAFEKSCRKFEQEYHEYALDNATIEELEKLGYTH